ncbi:MAG TPA: NlpC/P60 family protein [Azospirillaceae bacterium]|nr:NlpC/P60 family protein [Azospirillaceae bacterium]
MSAALDPRIHAYRPDLAAATLKGQVEAERFVDGIPCQVRAGFVTLAERPAPDSRQSSQLLFGEVFTALEEKDGWVWGQNATDGYVGYLRIEALDMEVQEPTHRVTALRGYLFPEPDLKSPFLDVLSLASPVTVVGERDGYAELAGGGWLYAKQLEPLDAAKAHDPVETALRFLGTPYLWGGRTSLGLDCSALVQLSLSMAGVACPRDSDQQRESVGTKISDDGRDVAYQRGDIVFFPGHVGIMADATDLVHANAFHMCVTREPLTDVVARAGAKGINGVRRL